MNDVVATGRHGGRPKAQTSWPSRPPERGGLKRLGHGVRRRSDIPPSPGVGAPLPSGLGSRIAAERGHAGLLSAGTGASGRARDRGVQTGDRVVLGALWDRLSPDEAQQVAAQFPRGLKEVWTRGDRPRRRPRKMWSEEFLQRVKHERRLPSGDAASQLTEAVFIALKSKLNCLRAKWTTWRRRHPATSRRCGPRRRDL